MLISRVVYFSVTGILIALNGAALLMLPSADTTAHSINLAALLVNIIMWPLALAVAYRVGQATGAVKFPAKPHHARHSG